jgi:hypothetical protein
MARLFLHTKDLQVIYGYSLRHAQRMYNRLRDSLGKAAKQKITIDEFVNFENLDKNVILQKLK